MLSVLIPIYNYDVSKLVKDLHSQLLQSNIAFELVLVEDASTETFFNDKLVQLSHVSHDSLQENIGRAKIRNLLVTKAKYPFLLFMDCDAAVISSSYINNYISKIQGKTKLMCVIGGVSYRDQKPKPEFLLRWYYGKKREMINADVRNIKPYKSFTSFNAVFSKSIFDTVKFDETFSTYGNEDTFFGDQLRDAQIKVTHINNPLFHDGLDTNENYFKKVETSIHNLITLLHDYKIQQEFIDENRLLTAYYKVKKLKLLTLLSKFYGIFLPNIKNKILRNPSIFWLDVYKLGYFILQIKK